MRAFICTHTKSFCGLFRVRVSNKRSFKVKTSTSQVPRVSHTNSTHTAVIWKTLFRACSESCHHPTPSPLIGFIPQTLKMLWFSFISAKSSLGDSFWTLFVKIEMIFDWICCEAFLEVGRWTYCVHGIWTWQLQLHCVTESGEASNKSVTNCHCYAAGCHYKEENLSLSAGFKAEWVGTTLSLNPGFLNVSTTPRFRSTSFIPHQTVLSRPSLPSTPNHPAKHSPHPVHPKSSSNSK